MDDQVLLPESREFYLIRPQHAAGAAIRAIPALITNGRYAHNCAWYWIAAKKTPPGALLWLFPAPPIRSHKADATKAPAANFNQTDVPFWADEKNHAES